MRVKEFIELFSLSILVKFKIFSEFLKTVFLYYRNISFAKADLLLLSSYLFRNPFKISKKFLLKKGERDVYAYGETPITSFAKIVKVASIKPSDSVFELGMGRGRCCFWLHFFIGCKVTGIDFVPEFVEKAEAVRIWLKCKNLQFLQQDMLKSDFSGGTIFYLYGTSYHQAFIKALIDKFKELPKNTKIITVSYPLSDYDDGLHFEVIKKIPINFTWGKADVYIQIVK